MYGKRNNGKGKGLGYEELCEKFKKGLRRGNWKKLNRREKALYRAAMAYTKSKRWGETVKDIVSRTIVEKLVAVIEKLKETKGMRIFKRGFKKAAEMLDKGDEIEVFVWAPRLKKWLRDLDINMFERRYRERIEIDKENYFKEWVWKLPKNVLELEVKLNDRSNH
jgi:hypothetical protein